MFRGHETISKQHMKQMNVFPDLRAKAVNGGKINSKSALDRPLEETPDFNFFQQQAKVASFFLKKALIESKQTIGVLLLAVSSFISNSLNGTQGVSRARPRVKIVEMSFWIVLALSSLKIMPRSFKAWILSSCPDPKSIRSFSVERRGGICLGFRVSPKCRL